MIVKLKSPTVHAIRIVKYIAANQGETLSASDICKAADITQSYFMRLVKDLRQAGILESNQGRYGGFYLSKPADQISLQEIIEAMQGYDPSTEEEGLEKLNRLIEEANARVNDILVHTSLAQL